MRNIERQNKDNRTGYIAQNNIYILVERLYLGKSEFMKIRKLLCLVFVLLSVCSNLIYMNVFAKEEKTVEERFDYRELEKAQPRIVSGDEGSDRDSVITKQSMSTEASLSSSEKGWKLPKDAINYRYIFQESRQIASIEQKGVYFLNDSQLTVYSLESLQGEEVYTFPSIVKDSYTAKGKLYVLSSGESSGESLISVYNLKQKKFEDTLSLNISASAIGIDDSGRIYLGGKEKNVPYIYLLSAKGRILSKAKTLGKVYGFGGFDNSNGNFYFEQYYNWYYWGSEHDMHALGTGHVSKNDLLVCTDVVASLISQNYYTERKYAIELVGDKYLCIDNTLHSRLEIWPSNKINPNKPDENDILFTLERDNNNIEGEFDHGACLGTRTIYNESRGSIIMFQNGQTLAEYLPETGKLIGCYQTAHPVFSMMKYGDNILAVEKEGDDLYLEEIECKAASYLKIRGKSKKMKPLGSMKLKASTNASFADMCRWESSNPKVASVTQAGRVFAWRKGKVTITVKNSMGLSAKYTITIKGSCPVKIPKKKVIVLKGKKSNNISDNDYTVWSSVVNSYLTENSNNTFTRVEYISDKVVVETFDTKTGKRKNRKTLKTELPYFGGFFSGSKYNYIVYGKSNWKQKDKTEVLRIVKYSKNFKRIGSVSVKGANTYMPFSAGSLRMAEANGKLYIHTCHMMYGDGDYYTAHHQANMTYVVNESLMKVEQSYYDVMNIAQAGYVSHSMNQFIQADDKYLFRVDHGDGEPRAVSLTRCELDGKITDVRYTLPLSIGGGYGDNNTGVSVGGFELSSDSCLIAGNSVPQGNKFKGTDKQRNIFVTVTPKDLSSSKVVWITRHKKNIIVNTPQLVKLGEDQFLLMWEERSAKAKTNTTKIVTLDGNGILTSKISSHGLPLSDCKPILFKNGLVGWYYTDNSAPITCFLNCYDLDKYRKSGVERVSIYGISGKIAAGKRIKLSAKIQPKDFNKTKLKWKSSNTKVATVDQLGNVTVKEDSGGKAVKITAKLTDGSGVPATFKITSMSGIVKDIEILGSKSVKAGMSIKLSANVWHSSSSSVNTELMWKSGNEKYAKVNNAGYVTTYKSGKGKKVKITALATDGSGVKKSVTIAIK